MSDLFWTAIAIAFASVFWAAVWLIWMIGRHRGRLPADSSLQVQILRDRCDRYGRQLAAANAELELTKLSLRNAKNLLAAQEEEARRYKAGVECAVDLIANALDDISENSPSQQEDRNDN